MNNMARFSLCLLFIALTAGLEHAQQTQSQPKRISVSFAVESEGPQQWLWAQSSQDLSKPQLQRLEQLIWTEISKQQDVTLVDTKDPKSHLHVAVIAAQLERQGSLRWIVVSSALIMSAEDGKGGYLDLLVTHDVISGPDLPSVARSIGFQLASAKLHLITGMMK